MSSESTVGPPRRELSAAKRALIEAKLRGKVRSSGIVPRTDRERAPLSFAQERLWFLDRLEPGSTTYNVPVAWRLRGARDEAALERALGEIIRRHETLRTVFAEVDGSPVQVIAPFGGFTLPVEDLSGLSQADREAALRQRAGEEAGRAFDLSAGPLFRAVLLRLGEEDRVLLLSMHHIVSDGWSRGVLSREFSALYEAYRDGRESPLPELPVQYADYAVWQREHLRGETLERQLAYWRDRLSGAPELLELPTDHPRPPVQTYRGATVPVELAPELLERLRALALGADATLYMVVLAAFQVLLSRYSGSEDVVVGSPIAGRTRKEVEDLIGFFVNTLVLRADLSGDPGFRAVLGRVREAVLGAYEHQELPFERLVEELQPERSLSHSPLFQVVFLLQDAGGQGGGAPGTNVSGAETELESVKFDLTLGLVATARGLRGGLTYRTDLFERGTIERMAQHLERALEQLASDPDRRLSALDLMGPVERAQVLEGWSHAAGPSWEDRTIHALFQEQAARTPDAVAVAGEDGTLTYGELDRRANRLAHHLVERGVGPEMRVGVCLERSPELVVALLAILKAGGAYVPLDPEFPAERLDFMMEDAAITVLLTVDRLRGGFPEHGAEVVLVDRITGGDAHPPAVAVSPEHLAYVIYTSGSTGVPKGAEVPHRAIPGFFRGADYVRFDERQAVLQHSSMSWDGLTLELWPVLLTGGRCVLYQGRSGDVQALADAVERHGVTTLWLTAALFDAVVDTAPGMIAGVSQVMTGGEMVS
ncbi:MAG TPA: condensation domain-containing protein, partial [Longimicrobium sp.]|nr:condensation domain-containing protein [Longimicrobium sp.]